MKRYALASKVTLCVRCIVRLYGRLRPVLVLTAVTIVLFAAPLCGQPTTPSLVDEISHNALYLGVGLNLGTKVYGTMKRAEPVQEKLGPMAVITGLTVAADWATHEIKKSGHPKWAVAARFFIAGLHGWAAARNLR